MSTQGHFFWDLWWGTLSRTIKNRVQDLGLSEYIEFTGRVSDDKLLDYLNTAIYVLILMNIMK